MYMVYPVHWLHSHSIELSESLNSEWVFITEFHIPPCELFHGLLFFLLLVMVIPIYNGV